MASLIPTVTVEVELSGPGGGWTDISTDILRTGITMRHGIDGSAPIDRVASTGTVSLMCNNSRLNSGGVTGYYSPRHASRRAGWDLGIGCRVRITDPATLTTFTRFIGRVDDINPDPGANRSQAVSVIGVDWLDEAARWALTPEIGEQVNKSWDAVLTAILAQMPIQPTAVDLSSGTEVYAYALDSSDSANQRALAEFQKLADSEFGLIYVKADGTLRAEDRHARMTTTASAWTLTDAEYQDLDLPSSRDDIINTVRVRTHPKVVDASATHIVYNQASVIPFSAGQTKELLGPYRNDETGEEIGATDIQPLVLLNANTAPDGSGSDVSSSFLVTVTAGINGVRFVITNNTIATAYLVTVQLIGKRILDHGTYQHEATDPTSIATHGEHVVEFDMPYQSSFDVGQGAADFILSKFKNPLAQARTISVMGRTSALLTQILTRDISDRITLSETVTGVSDDFYVNGIELQILPEGFVQATYTLTPAQDPFSGVYWILGTSTLGTDTIPAPF